MDFLAGDLRVNEQPFLTSMHVLFMREHNRQEEALVNYACVVQLRRRNVKHSRSYARACAV